MNDIGYIPPQAIETEDSVLGALILESESYSKISGLLRPEMFYREENKTIFETIAEMHRNQKNVDLVTVVQTLKDAGKLNQIGGPLYISKLTRNVGSAAHLEHHAQIIAEKYLLRKAIITATKIQKIAYDNGDAEDIIDSWTLFESEVINTFTGYERGATMYDTLKDTFNEIENRTMNFRDGKLPGISTGFRSLDRISGGWRKGRLIVVGGRPGHGKSSIALHFALTAAQYNIPVYFFSLEMIKNELVEICLSGISDVSRTAIRDGELLDSDFNKLNKAAGTIEKLPILWFDNPDLSASKIIGIVKNKMRKTGKGIVIIDYLQLIRPEKVSKSQIREQQVAEISRALKRLTLSEKIPVILLSQLNRQGDVDEPRLSHLRESGSIEQDADIVLLVWKPEKDGFTNTDNIIGYKNLIQMKVAKNRQGGLGTLMIYDNGQMTRFSEKPFEKLPY